MTSEEHDRYYMKTFEQEELIRGYIECDAIAQRLASRFPEDPKVWIGTTSQRLAYLAGLLTKDMEAFEDMTSKSPLKKVVYSPIEYELTVENMDPPYKEPIGFFPVDPKTYHEHPDCKQLHEQKEPKQ